MKLLITDLDNTLYDWVTFFSKSFEAMVVNLSKELSIDINILLDEFKVIHQKYGNTEQPFAILELPSVQKHYGELSRMELMERLNKPLHAFNSTRKKNLKLYAGVSETLHYLSRNGVKIVGHTEAIPQNAYYRLLKLNILPYFSKLYSLDGLYLGHPIEDRAKELAPPENFIQLVPKAERKPNPSLLLDICSREKVPATTTYYIGDSLIRDISMAKNAGIMAIWAKYGTECDKHLWDILVRVTHWTDEDVVRENELKRKANKIEPDAIIENFSQIVDIIKL